MRKICKLILFIMIITALSIISGCGGSGEGTPGPIDAETTESFDSATTTGDEGSLTVGSQTVDFIYANSSSSDIIFPSAINDSLTGTISRQFFMSKTEVTWAVCVKVLQWAYDSGKIVETSDAHNEVNGSTVQYGGQELFDLDYDSAHMKISFNIETNNFSVASGYENYPVVGVSWFGTIMFCNWLTEMRDDNTDNVVYTGITDSWDESVTVANDSKTGYRLPSNAEWEFTARYYGTSNGVRSDLVSNTTYSALTEGYYWTPGDYASGATADYNDADACELVAIYNDGTEPYATAQPVAGKAANALGLFDMSGNVLEWTFTLQSSSYRYAWGGCWYWADSLLQIGMNPAYNTNTKNCIIGFRFARTQ